MPEVVKADAVESSPPRHCLPWTLQIGARLLGVVARHDIGAEPIEAGQHCKRWSVQDHGFPAGLGVGEKQQAALQVDLLAFEMQDFPESTAGEKQKADRGCRKGAD